jgi:hypothetical protein
VCKKYLPNEEKNVLSGIILSYPEKKQVKGVTNSIYIKFAYPVLQTGSSFASVARASSGLARREEQFLFP